MVKYNNISFNFLVQNVIKYNINILMFFINILIYNIFDICIDYFVKYFLIQYFFNIFQYQYLI